MKRFDATRCDYLFVLAGDGRRWFIPAARVEGRVCISVGGGMYSEFEIDPPHRAAVEQPSLESTPLWGSARAVKGSRL